MDDVEHMNGERNRIVPEEEKKVKEHVDAKNRLPNSASRYSALPDHWKCHVNDGSMTMIMVSFDVF